MGWGAGNRAYHLSLLKQRLQWCGVRALLSRLARSGMDLRSPLSVFSFLASSYGSLMSTAAADTLSPIPVVPVYDTFLRL